MRKVLLAVVLVAVGACSRPEERACDAYEELRSNPQDVETLGEFLDAAEEAEYPQPDLRQVAEELVSSVKLRGLSAVADIGAGSAMADIDEVCATFVWT